jgi:plastocyanin
MRKDRVRNFVLVLVTTFLLSPSSHADSKTKQLCEGAARPPLEVVTIILWGPTWGILGGVAGTKILLNGKWVTLHNFSQVLPGTYEIAVTALCGGSGPGPTARDTHIGFATYHTKFTAEAGDTVTFLAGGGSFPVGGVLVDGVLVGSETCYGHSFWNATMSWVSYLDPSSQTPKPLPTETSKMRGLYPVTVEIPGTASSFRIAAGSKPTFTYKAVGDHNITDTNIFRISIKGKNRQFVAKGPIAVDRSKDGDSSYKVTVSLPVEPGEYAFVTGDVVFSFGVDAPGK